MGFRIKNIAGSNLNLDAMESKIHVLSDKYLKTVLDSLTFSGEGSKANPSSLKSTLLCPRFR